MASTPLTVTIGLGDSVFYQLTLRFFVCYLVSNHNIVIRVQSYVTRLSALNLNSRDAVQAVRTFT